jgi:hemerythrin-like metal-binding protein
MLKLTFGDELLTEHEGIDKQHETMFAWGRKILATPAEVSPTDLARTIHFLGTYVRYHFAAEEYFMNELGYHRAGPHRSQHDGLRQQVKEIHEAAAAGQSPSLLLARVHTLFEDWYVYHITEWDKPFAAFLRGKQSAEDSRELPTVQLLLTANKLHPVEDDIDLSAIEVVAQERWHRTPKTW